jgi:3-phosphoshikimate 1-carboxyvinyltransferase
MAMCFALAAFGGAAITVRDPECVGKTFPEFFAVFGSVVQ